MNIHGRRYMMRKDKGMWKTRSVKRLNKREGDARVEEPLVLAAGKVIEVILDSRILPVWSRKLGFSMSIQRTGDRRFKLT